MVRVECPIVQMVKTSSAIPLSEYALEREFRQRVQFTGFED